MRYLLLCSYQCIKSSVIANHGQYSTLYEIKKVSLIKDAKQLQELQTAVMEEIEKIETSPCLTLSSPYLTWAAVFKVPGSSANDTQTAFDDLGAYIKKGDAHGQNTYEGIAALNIAHVGYISNRIGHKEYSLQEVVKAEFDQFLYEWLEGRC